MNVGSTQNIKSFEILTSSVLLFMGAAVVLPIFWGAYFHKEQQSRAEEQVLAYQIMQIHQKHGAKEADGMTSQRGPASVAGVDSYGSEKTDLIRQIGKDPWGTPYNYQVQVVDGRPQVTIWSLGPAGKRNSHDQFVQAVQPGSNTFVQFFE